jgi:hypothetical protein
MLIVPPEKCRPATSEPKLSERTEAPKAPATEHRSFGPSQVFPASQSLEIMKFDNFQGF